SPPPLLKVSSTITINTNPPWDMESFLWEWIAPDLTLIQSGTGSITQQVLSLLNQTGDFLLRITYQAGAGGGQYDVSLSTSVVPLPPALRLFGTGLAGLALLMRRRGTSKPEMA